MIPSMATSVPFNLFKERSAAGLVAGSDSSIVGFSAMRFRRVDPTLGGMVAAVMGFDYNIEYDLLVAD